MTADDERWSTDDVAAWLHVSPATVRSYAGRGQMPAPDGRLGRTPWWRPKTITTWHADRPRPERQRRPHTSSDPSAVTPPERG